jgi:uncharacterized protein (DUF2147 family)
MRGIFLALCIAGLITSAAQADGIEGMYRTEPSDTGGVLHIKFGTCEADGALTCATIFAAFDAERAPVADYAYLGKRIVWNMKDMGGGKFAGGKIWDPTANKTYNLKMRRRGSAIRVSECVGPICKAQNWHKVE